MVVVVVLPFLELGVEDAGVVDGDAVQDAVEGIAVGWVDTFYCGTWSRGRMSVMPKKYPPEFKRDVVTVARRGDLSVVEVATDFGVAEETVRRWMKQADVDDGIKDGLTTAEQAEIVQLRRDKRRLEMENEILRRAAAYFAASSLPK
jgi:transposase